MKYIRKENCIEIPSFESFRFLISDEFKYLGSHRIIIKDNSKADLLIFVVSDNNKTINKYFLVQIEKFLPNNDFRYNYSSETKKKFSGYEFYLDNFCFDIYKHAEEYPDSDVAQMIDFCKEQGYKMPRVNITNRLVHVFGEDHRKEILLIYAEDLTLRGFTFKDMYNEREGFTTLFHKEKLKVRENALKSFKFQ
jgi:hypothetical protein